MLSRTDVPEVEAGSAIVCLRRGVVRRPRMRGCGTRWAMMCISEYFSIRRRQSMVLRQAHCLVLDGLFERPTDTECLLAQAFSVQLLRE